MTAAPYDWEDEDDGLVLDPMDMDLLAYHWSRHGQGYLKRTIGTAGTPGCEEIMLHRVVAERIFGEIPSDRLVDHINGRRRDNRRCNLRLVDRSQHAANSASTNRSGYRWVYPDGKSTKFVAEIKWRGERYRRGGFATAQEAYDWATSTAQVVQGNDNYAYLRHLFEVKERDEDTDQPDSD